MDPPLLCELNLPATSTELAKAEAELGRPLPPVLQTIYRRYDGLQCYHRLGEGRTTLASNMFACAASDVRTAWLHDADDERSFAEMIRRGDSPLAVEHNDFVEEVEEHIAGHDDVLLAEIRRSWLCFATDWDGSAGWFYCLRDDDAMPRVCLVPKPRFMSTPSFLASLRSPKTQTMQQWLADVGAPAWLADASLYDETTTLMFHSRSRDAKPGRGAAERGGGSAFAALSEIADWRRLLSNFSRSEFELDGRRWATVEHYFQAAKFREIAPDYWERFTLDSGSELGDADGGAARSAGGKRGHPLSLQQRIDWEARRWGVMERALVAKYSANPLHRRALLATGTACLTHKPARARFATVEYPLMVVRAALGS